MEKEPNTLVAIVQAQDADEAEKALNEIGVNAYQLPSVGGFLGRKNVTLVIPIRGSSEGEIVQILKDNCRQRIEYNAIPLDSAPMAIPTPTSVCVGGATIFGLEAEQIEIL